MTLLWRRGGRHHGEGDRRRHRRRHRHRRRRLHPGQPPPGPARGRRGDRARAQPQAVLRRRAARGTAPQPSARQRPGAHRHHRGGPAAVLAQRARPAERRHRELRPDLRQPRQPSCSRPPRRAATTAPAATAPRASAARRRPTRSPTPTGSSSPPSPGGPRPSTPCSCASPRRSCAQILVYGRPGTPMPAWGTEGGGPLTTQQIDELIAYIGSIQLTSRRGQGGGRGGGPQRARPRRGRRDRLGRPGHRRGALQPRA